MAAPPSPYSINGGVYVSPTRSWTCCPTLGITSVRRSRYRPSHGCLSLSFPLLNSRMDVCRLSNGFDSRYGARPLRWLVCDTTGAISPERALAAEMNDHLGYTGLATRPSGAAVTPEIGSPQKPQNMQFHIAYWDGGIRSRNDNIALRSTMTSGSKNLLFGG